MITLACEPDYAKSLYERLVEAWLENLRRFHAAVGDRVQILQFNDDLGTQDAPFLSVKMFRELVMPRLSAMIFCFVPVTEAVDDLTYFRVGQAVKYERTIFFRFY